MFNQDYRNTFEACSAQALAESRSAIRIKKEIPPIKFIVDEFTFFFFILTPPYTQARERWQFQIRRKRTFFHEVSPYTRQPFYL